VETGSATSKGLRATHAELLFPLSGGTWQKGQIAKREAAANGAPTPARA
jgi:hypothetical protein